MLYKGNIINPDPYLKPCYKLSPFCNTDIKENNEFPSSSCASDYFKNKHKDLQFLYTTNGRAALNMALQSLNLNPNDIVSILTTSQNFYISGCVTREIEKFCKWDREVTSSTKVIFVNHEFGFPFGGMEELRNFNIPIIEDCAYSFSSQSKNSIVGHVGDFVIYSFPKFFPIQIGGMLAFRNNLELYKELPSEDLLYINNVISPYLSFVDQFSDLRRANYNYLEKEFKKYGLLTRFGELAKGVVPGVFMFKVPDHIDTGDLKNFFYANGVESSVFYGESSFFIPCHHRLSKVDLDYFIILIDFYLNIK
ncbi:hypothetical protein AAKU52_000639 [Pedobacter sp. CG_S7]|uniref:DegT/DnrJ/EryC1/StrS family aminotransferase n=1 Tax=Pedobacter sp. CG_S7 TaxID=3143930 RepID=UPI00339AEB05